MALEAGALRLSKLVGARAALPASCLDELLANMGESGRNDVGGMMRVEEEVSNQ